MLLCLRPGLFRLTDLGVVISEPNITLITFGVTSYALSRADVENRLASNLNSNIETSSEGFSEPLATTGDVGLKKGKVTYRPSPLDLDTTLVDLGSNYAKQSIISFLEKPYELRSGTWDATSTGTFISVNLPSELITTPIYQNKAMGHLCFRATIVLRLQVNATRFSQGRLIMSYIPQAPVLNSWYKGRLLDLTTITQLPNVQLDANCDKEVVLEIPYTSPTTHYGLLSQLGPACGAFVSVYSPLATVSGLDVAQYILWGSFKNVELVTPTSATPFTTQGPAIRTRNRDPSDQEAEAAELTPISGALSKVSRASTILAEIPLLTSIAGPTAWLTRAASKAAAAFGWSNPTVLSPVKRIVNFGHSYANNCDAGQSALPLSLSSDNKVGILPGVGATDIDEMSLSFIASNPAYYASYNWSIVNIPGTVIYGQDLAPANFTHAYTDTVLTGTAGNTIYYRTMTPISFITRNFAYYRGSLKFTFKLVKTEFHTGRLLLTYSPGYFSDPTITESTYLMREVIDISKGSEFSYTIPFAAVTPWLPSGTSYGRLSLLVLNNLAAPATVTSTIQILVEVSGADDFQWFGPYATEGELNIPYMPSGTFNGGVFTSQMDDLCDITDQNTIIAAGSLHSNDLAALNYCAGEAITSVSQLLKRSCHFSTSAHWPNAVVEMIFRPFSIYALSAARATFTTDFPLICNDYFSLFSSCFAYNRGSVVLRQAAWGGTQYRFYSKLFFFTSSFIPGVTNTGIYATNTATSTISNNLKSHTFQDSNLAIANAVVIPNYNQCHARLCRYSMNELDSVVMEPVDTYSSNVWCQVNLNAGAASLRIERSVGDDFQLSFFLGVPPICYATATL